MRPPDHDVRQRITTDLSRNFLVEAGAGSGKTHSLAERMASGIAAGRYEIGQMVAVTFTRKAAAELRGRFQLALEARLAAQPAREEGERLETALAGIERFFAGTIHAFCARLLRERPVEAGVAPGFIELDEVDDDLARRRAWRDFLARESATGAASLSALRAVDLRPADLDRAFAAVCEHADVTFPPGDAVPPDVDAAWRALDACWSEIASHLPASIDPDTTCGVQKLAGAFAGRMALARRNRAADLAGLLDPWRSLQVRKKWWGTGASRGNPVADRIADLVAAFERDTVLPFLERWRAWVYRQAMVVLVQGREFYALERRRHNFVNYVDLLMMTARMLREHALVRRALQQKFRWLFIDEFQDTDPIQAEVFALLAADESGVAGDVVPDWTTLPLRSGALFVVGDPKQSIYRFRRADIDTYMLVRRRIESCGGDVLRLTANFRSTPALCAFANRVFESRFPLVATPEAPAFEPLEPVRPESGPDGPSVLAHVLPADVHAKQSPAVEAERIAAWIRGAVEQGGRGFGDFLVLTRNRPRLKQYAQTFEREGIPVEVSGAGSFGGSSEVDALRQLLMALADPMDTPALVGVLRGPLFGLSDVDLFRFRQSGGRLDLSVRVDDESTAVPEGTKEGAADAPQSLVACADALRLLNQLFRRTRRLPLGAALEHVFEHTGLLAWAAATPSGAGAGDLLQALDRVRQLAERGGGWADAVAMLSDDAPEANDVEALPLEPGRRDVVRLMNLHKAKGLEADVVFLADPCYAGRFPADLRVVREGRQATGWLRIVRKSDERFGETLLAQPSDWQSHAAIENRYLDAEQDRLLYVAATRARELLVVGQHETAKENKAWSVLSAFLSERAADPPPTKAAVSQPALFNEPLEGQRQQAATARHARGQRAVQPSWSIASVSDEAHQSARAHRIRRSAGGGAEKGTEAVEAGDPTRTLLGDSASHRGDAGAAWGALVHGLLEYATQHGAATDDDLRRLARWLVIETPDLRPFIDSAVACVDAIRHAPFWTSIQASTKCFVEVPFIHRTGVERPPTPAQSEDRPAERPPDRPPVAAGSALQITMFEFFESQGQPAPEAPADAPITLIRGVIDLVCHDGTGWRIVDYKTDQILVDPSELASRYGEQVNRYVLAWQDVIGQPVARAELFHTRTLKLVSVQDAAPDSPHRGS